MNAEEWVKALAEHGHHELSYQIHQVVPCIEKEIALEFGYDNLPQFKAFHSLNISALFLVFQHIEQNCPCSCRIFHDKIASFEEAYRTAFVTLKNAKRGAIALGDKRIVVTGLETINCFDFIDSKTDSLIRSADFLTSATAYYFKLLHSGHQIPEYIQRIAFCSLGAFLVSAFAYEFPDLGGSINLGTIIASKHWIKKALGFLMSQDCCINRKHNSP